MSLKHDIHNRSHCDFEIHVKITGVNRAWGKSTTPIPDFPQALFTRVNIPAKVYERIERERTPAEKLQDAKKSLAVKAQATQNEKKVFSR